MSEQYVVVGSHDWTDQIFDEVICGFGRTGQWFASGLNTRNLVKYQAEPRVFFALVFKSTLGYNE